MSKRKYDKKMAHDGKENGNCFLKWKFNIYHPSCCYFHYTLHDNEK